jgi:hypothetical protein
MKYLIILCAGLFFTSCTPKVATANGCTPFVRVKHSKPSKVYEAKRKAQLEYAKAQKAKVYSD